MPDAEGAMGATRVHYTHKHSPMISRLHIAAVASGIDASTSNGGFDCRWLALFNKNKSQSLPGIQGILRRIESTSKSNV
jgi:hypothetical protein